MNEEYFHINEYKYAALRFGNNGKHKIIATHGWLDNAASFIPMAKLLQDDYDIIAVDLLGHGNSSWHPKGLMLHSLQEVACLSELIKIIANDHEPITLLGHSLGAGYASIAAATVPNLVKNLVCIDALGPLMVPEHRLPGFFAESIEQYSKLDRKIAPTYQSLDKAVEARQRNTDLSKEATRLLVERGTFFENGIYKWKNDPRLTLYSVYRLSELQVKSFLSKIQCETLLIEPDAGWPDLDGPPYELRKEYIPNLQVHKVIGHHHVHMDNPEAIASLIKKFIGK